METPINKIPEWTAVDATVFYNEIVPLNRPAVLRSLVSGWPAVSQARKSASELASYLKRFDNGGVVNGIVGDPGIKGRFFYREDLQDINFNWVPVTVSIALDRLIKVMEQLNPHAISIPAVPVKDILPGFREQNSLPLLDKSVPPTMWFGNKGRVAAHFDIHDNVACVVAGVRKFTLFPPDQIRNLYVGPILNAPGGVPISMVDLHAPDVVRFPRFAEALQVAQEATLEPGDAIYIPALWWHAVESMQSFNMLVNYWWGGESESGVSPKHSLLHSILGIAKLSTEKRAAWASYFDYYLFQDEVDPSGHFPPAVMDIVTKLSPGQKEDLLHYLSDHLQQGRSG